MFALFFFYTGEKSIAKFAKSHIQLERNEILPVVTSACIEKEREYRIKEQKYNQDHPPSNIQSQEENKQGKFAKISPEIMANNASGKMSFNADGPINFQAKKKPIDPRKKKNEPTQKKKPIGTSGDLIPKKIQSKSIHWKKP